MSARILLVDDDPNHLRSLGIGLRLEGFQVEEASGGDAALERLESTKVDLAIIDVMMPGINGLDLARRMQLRHPDVLLVMASAYPLSKRQIGRAGINAVGFVPKPFDIPELAAFLQDKLRSRLASATA